MAIEIPSAGEALPSPAAAPVAGARRGLSALRRVPLGRVERALFTERLALLIETGSPVHAALATLLDQVDDNPRLHALVQALMEHILAGVALSEACRRHPEFFPSSYVQLVAAGERGGFLAEVLQELVSMDEKAERLRSTLLAALSYPLFLLAFSLAVTLFVLIWVFPKFGELFNSIRGDLPASTLFLMALSDTLRAHGLLIAAVVGASGAVVRNKLRTTDGRALIDGLKLRIPLLRDILVRVYLVQSLRVLALSLERGVSAMDALAAVRDVVDNSAFRAFIVTLERHVSEGRGLAPGFRQAGFLPPMVHQMVSTGEQTGSLALVFGRMADYYERELNRLLATFGRLVEPLMLLVMGSVVGLMVSSLILPIFKLARAVH